MLRTPEEVRKEFENKGLSIAKWSVTNGFSPTIVYDVLNGKRNPTRGQTHNIAVKLGLKDGEVGRDQDIASALSA